MPFNGWEIRMRIIGMMMVFIASSGIGIAYSYMYKKRIEDLSNWKKCIIHLKNEINFSLTPLPEAFEMISKRYIGPFSTFFYELSCILDNHSTTPLIKLDEKKLRDLLNGTCLGEKDNRVIIDFIKNIGLSDKDSQISTINLHLESLENEIQDARKDEEKNNKLYKTLGVLAGIFIIVIFI